jgi:hypothetical protein
LAKIVSRSPRSDRSIVPQERRLLVADRARRLRQALARDVDRQATRQQLVADHAERVHVRARIDPLRIPLDLLRAHVRDRPEDLARARERRPRPQVLRRRARDAEVEHLRRPVLVDEDVRRLQVAVDHALLVRVVHGAAHLREQLDAARRAQPGRVGVLRERPAEDELHREERLRARAGVGVPAS